MYLSIYALKQGLAVANGVGPLSSVEGPWDPFALLAAVAMMCPTEALGGGGSIQVRQRLWQQRSFC
jgi:hypothetical protein